MFESVVSDLLKTYLGDYVEGLDKDALSISVWKGAYRIESAVYYERVRAMRSNGCIMNVANALLKSNN